jgi:hypothetical protein
MGVLDEDRPNIVDCKWSNPTGSIIENLQAVRDKFMRATGADSTKELHVSSGQLIAMYQHGIISPKDTTIALWITDGVNGAERVRKFLNGWDGKIEELDWGSVVDL